MVIYLISRSFLSFQECDLGQQSVLHAVRTPPKRKQHGGKNNSPNVIEESMSEGSEYNSGSKPMNETLSDLPLEESEQQPITAEQGNYQNQCRKNVLVIDLDFLYYY